MMKKSILFVVLFFCFVSNGIAQEEIKIDIENSEVKWLGSKLFSFGKHYGVVKIKDGNLISNNGKISGGSFTIDMNTIKNTDGEYSEMLIGHLKNEDFFDVKNHPTASLEITKVIHDQVRDDMEIHANLTIKSITNPIIFFAKQSSDNNDEVSTKFIIDRTKWNVNFGSPGITNIQDHIISDAIEFEITLKLN